MLKYLFTFLLACIGWGVSYARLVIPKILGNNMVLQQRVKVAVWGWANVGQEVTVTFKEQKVKAWANEKGEWKLWLKPMESSFQPSVMEVDAGEEQIRLENILVGEVWLCSGQSNMQYPMRKLAKLLPPPGNDWPVDEVANADNEALRIFLVERKKMKPDSTHSGWHAAKGKPLEAFSAVGYFFAKQLSEHLRVPVGIISAAISGSRIEPWMPKEAMEVQNYFARNKDKSEGKIGGDPGKFYTSMIEPLIPFTLKGFLWYQGESNCFLNERLEYSYKMKSLIDYWRLQWKNEQLPFYYVQIAPFHYSKAIDRPFTIYSEPEFWEAQAAVLKVPNTTMIATIDLNRDLEDLHPVNKWDVGRRLANSALVKTYQEIKGTPMGPVFNNAKRVKTGFVIDFDFKGDGLKGKKGLVLNGFEIAGIDSNYRKADAVLRNNKVWVTSRHLDEPVAVRYAWREDAEPTLFNRQGLPALPFRTSDSIIGEFEF